MTKYVSSDLMRKLREVALDIRELDLPQQRVEYKRLLFKAQELRLQLIYLGEVAAVDAFDEQTVALGTFDNTKWTSAVASDPQPNKTDEELEIESVDAPLVNSNDGDPKTSFSLPVSFLISQGASASISPANEVVSSLIPALGGDMTVPRVFIQYAHIDQQYVEDALELAFRLRADGVEAIIDQFDPNPKEGWPTWMTKQLRDGDFVLVLCSKENLERFDKVQPPPTGTGATWEGHLIQQYLHNAGVINQKFIPVFLRPEDRAFVPGVLQAFTHYSVYEPAEYDRLLRFLTNQPEVEVPPVSPTIRKMPPRRP